MLSLAQASHCTQNSQNTADFTKDIQSPQNEYMSEQIEEGCFTVVGVEEQFNGTLKQKDFTESIGARRYELQK